MRRLVLAGAAAAAVSGCATVKHVQTVPDWKTVDALRVKRLVVVTAPLPGGDEAVGKMWSRIARRHANQRRDFIAKEEKALPALESPTSLCGEGLEGVLWLRPWMEKRGSGVEAKVDASLVRCVDGQVSWRAEAAGSWPSEDADLAETVKGLVSDFGEGVAPWAAPSFRLLKATLDTLPNPVLEEKDVDEKIELGD